MIPSNFIVFYVVLGLLVITWIVYGKKRKPSKLNLRKSASNLPDSSSRMRRYYEDVRSGTKSLDCFFMYNGHEFNAYEVLEIPAGAPKEMIEEAYKDKLEKSDPSQKPFFNAAYRAAIEWA